MDAMDYLVLFTIASVFLFDVSTAIDCKQCYSFRTVNATSMQSGVIASILPNMINLQCENEIRQTNSVTQSPNIIPGNVNNQDLPPIPTLCPNAEVVGTNTEIRCGFYTGHIVVRSTDPQYGSFTMSVSSLSCFNVEVSTDYGCHYIDYPRPNDYQHFQNILNTRLSTLATLDRFVGSVCYCQGTNCRDVSSGTSLKASLVLLIPSAILVLKKYFI